MHPDRREHHLHRPGHHRPRGREPHARVPGLRARRSSAASRPGRKGREVHGVPVFDTVAAGGRAARPVPDGSVVTVPPAFTKDAVFEAIEAGVKLIVIVTERIPRYDVAQMVELANLRGARIIGPNCLGIIRPGVVKMGGIGGPAQGRREGLLARPGRRDVALGRHDDRDLVDADRRGPRRVHRRARSAATRSSAPPTPS